MFDPKKPSAQFFIPSIITGCLLALALPWFGLSFLVWIAFIPLFFFISDIKTNYKQAFQAGMVTGIVYFSFVVYPLFSLKAWWWLDVTGVVYDNKFLLLFWILYGAVLMASILFGLFAVAFKKVYKKGFLSIIMLATLWILLEYIHAKILFGFTWGHLGYSLHDFLPLLQIAQYGGVYSLSFLIIFVNILLYHAICRAAEKDGQQKKITMFLGSLLRSRYLYIAILTVSAACFYGYNLLAEQPKSKDLMSVIIIQPGNQKSPREVGEASLRMIKQSLIVNPALVVISESAFFPIVINEDTVGSSTSSVLSGKDSYSILLKISKENPATSFVIGAETQQGEDHYNSILVLEKGIVASIYHKRVLFPFSERPVSWLRMKILEPLASGTKSEVILVKGRPASALICSEVLFAGLVSDPRTHLVIAIGNDGVFQSPVVAEYNSIIAKYLAVETHKYLVRAMKTGVSSIVSPSGYILEQSNSINSELILGNVPN